jgi:hypothetical protein
LSIPTQYQDLSGFKTVYTETELRAAIAVAEVLLENNIGTGGGGGGGGITQAEVQAAIEAATNIDDLESLLTDLSSRLPSTLSSDRLKVDGSGVTQPVSGTVEITNDVGSAIPVSAASLPLPTGASTSANQVTGNTSLASIDTKTPALGATTAANSTPVTLATDGVFINSVGANSDAAATTDTGTFSLISLFKRFLSNGSRLLDSAGVIQASIKAASTQPALTDTALVTTSRDTNSVTVAFASGTTNLFDGSVDGYTHYIIRVTNPGTLNILGGENSGTLQAVAVEALTSNNNNAPFATSIVNGQGTDFKGNIYFKYLRVTGTANTAGSITFFKSAPFTTAARVQVLNSTLTTSATVAATTVKLQTYVSGTINSSGDNTIIAAPGVGQRIFITAITIQNESTTTTTVLFKSAATTVRRLRCVADGDGISLQYSPGFELRLGANEAFILNLSGANAVGYSVEYYTA